MCLPKAGPQHKIYFQLSSFSDFKFKNMNRHKSFILIWAIGLLLISGAFINACKTPEEILMKSGAQLWGENCNRCHNAPDPATYSDDQWDVITEHMRHKALLTDTEISKVREFMKAANKHF